MLQPEQGQMVQFWALVVELHVRSSRLWCDYYFFCFPISPIINYSNVFFRLTSFDSQVRKRQNPSHDTMKTTENLGIKQEMCSVVGEGGGLERQWRQSFFKINFGYYLIIWVHCCLLEKEINFLNIFVRVRYSTMNDIWK